MTKIKKARIAAGFSQKQVSLSLRVSAPTVSDWESGKIIPSPSHLKELACLFRVSVDYLLNLTDDPSYSCSPLADFIRTRRGDEPDQIFADRCSISVDLLHQIESGFRVSEDGPSGRTGLSTDELRSIASALSVDWQYLACLHDGYNPLRVGGIQLPDLIPYSAIFGEHALPVSEEAFQTIVGIYLRIPQENRPKFAQLCVQFQDLLQNIEGH